MKRVFSFIALLLLPLCGFAQDWFSFVVDMNLGTSISDSQYQFLSGDFLGGIKLCNDNMYIGCGLRLSSGKYDIKDFKKDKINCLGIILDARGFVPISEKADLVIDGKIGVIGGDPKIQEETSTTVTKYKANMTGPLKSIGVGARFLMEDGGYVGAGLCLERYDYDLTMKGEPKYDLPGINCVCLQLGFYF